MSGIDAPLARASALVRRGSVREAVALLEGLLAREPANADALHLMGLACKQAGDLPGALNWMQRSVVRNPRRPDFLGNLGNALAAVNRQADAEQAYRAALRLDPAFRPARLGLIRTLGDLGHVDAACAEAHGLIARDASDAEAWSALGSSLTRKGDSAGATAAFERALAARPVYGFARFGLGTVLLREFRPDEALSHFDRAVAEGYETPGVARARAQALLDLVRYDEADAVLAAALARWPDDVESHRVLVQLRFTRGDPGFLRSLEQAVELRPSVPSLQALLSDLLRRAGDPQRSEAVARTALDRFGPSPSLHSALAIALQEQGRLTEALDWARRAQAASPDDTGLVENLVVLQLALGEAEAVLPLIETQRARRPADQRWFAHLATAARLAGRDDYARLYNYDRFVRPFDLDVPPGWTSLEAFHAELLPALQQRHLLQAAPLDQSLRFGTQTARSLLAETHPAIRALLAALLATVAGYRVEIGHDPSHPFLQRNRGHVRMAGCWSVRLRRGGHHVNHVHPEGWISSAYYVHVPAEVSDSGTKNGWIKFGEPNVPTPGASAAHFVQPRAGRLVLFPSYMWHGTTPIQGDEPRVTVAFDVVPV